LGLPLELILQKLELLPMSPKVGFSNMTMKFILHHKLMTEEEVLCYLNIHGKKKLHKEEKVKWDKIYRDVTQRISDIDRMSILAESYLNFDPEYVE
jgi:tRNA 2-selenouridine synthase SelU